MSERGLAALLIALMTVPPLAHTAPYVYGNPKEPSTVFAHPHLTLQGLLMVGCLATLAFAPSYPRLVFALSYNALFAALQVMVGAAVVLLVMRQERRHQMALTA